MGTLSPPIAALLSLVLPGLGQAAIGRRTRGLSLLAQWNVSDSLTLKSITAYRAGEINLTQLLLATRQVLDTRREVLEAMTELALTRVDLEQAAGWTGETAK